MRGGVGLEKKNGEELGNGSSAMLPALDDGFNHVAVTFGHARDSEESELERESELAAQLLAGRWGPAMSMSQAGGWCGGAWGGATYNCNLCPDRSPSHPPSHSHSVS